MAKILLIEDDLKFRPIVRAALEKAGHVVTEAGNGKEGIAKYHADPADVVITDLVMPEKEGIETIMALRRDFPSVKIIAMSGSAHSGTYLHLAKQLGARRTLGKPFAAEELLGAIDAALGET
jgi:CheY-like chemotaxis protein